MRILPARRRQRGFIINPFWGGTPPPTDPYFSTVVMLCHFDGANGSSTFTNQSALGLPFSQTPRSSTDVISTAQSVFGGASLRRGSSGGVLASSGTDSDYTFGTSDFTIEFRFRPDTVQTANIFDMRTSGGGNTPAPTIYTLSNGTLVYYHSNTDRITSSTGVITATTWKAIAVSRVSGTTRMFVDGTQVGSSYTDSTNYSTSTQPHCGSYASQQTNAYYDEVRISNGAFGSGAGRYSGNYTIAASAFPDS
jgi:hypothetical protein